MITGAHVVLYSKDAEADREFFRDVLHFPSVDAGTAGSSSPCLRPRPPSIPPNKMARTSSTCSARPQAEMQTLAETGVVCSPVHEERWGSITRIKLPGGGVLGLYQPKHPSWRSDCTLSGPEGSDVSILGPSHEQEIPPPSPHSPAHYDGVSALRCPMPTTDTPTRALPTLHEFFCARRHSGALAAAL